MSCRKDQRDQVFLSKGPKSTWWGTRELVEPSLWKPSSDGFPGAGTDPGEGPILTDGAWENPSRGQGHRGSSGSKDSVL